MVCPFRSDLIFRPVNFWLYIFANFYAPPWQVVAFKALVYLRPDFFFVLLQEALFVPFPIFSFSKFAVYVFPFAHQKMTMKIVLAASLCLVGFVHCPLHNPIIFCQNLRYALADFLHFLFRDFVGKCHYVFFREAGGVFPLCLIFPRFRFRPKINRAFCRSLNSACNDFSLVRVVNAFHLTQNILCVVDCTAPIAFKRFRDIPCFHKNRIHSGFFFFCLLFRFLSQAKKQKSRLPFVLVLWVFRNSENKRTLDKSEEDFTIH